MANTRIAVANLATELFPHMPNVVESLRCLISVATEIIDDIESLEKMMSLPVGTTEDPVVYYETQVGEPEYDEDPF